MSYTLLYNQDLLINTVKPVLTIEQLIYQSNDAINKRRRNLTLTDKDNLARLVRVNWIVHDLDNNDIIKPILLRFKNFNFEVVTGDSRLQALQVVPKYQHIQALLTIQSRFYEDHANQFNDSWIQIMNKGHLCDVLNQRNKYQLRSGDRIFTNYHDWKAKELDWIEIAYDETSNDMHSDETRLTQILNYLNAQENSFQFTREWFKETIDWSSYS